MNARRLAIILGVALAISVALNLFAGAATITALSAQPTAEPSREGAYKSEGRPSTAQLLERLDPETREATRQALREAGLRARPDFQAARAARREAVEAARADPLDRARIEALLAQAREAEARGRARLEGDALTILEGLRPEDRRAFADVLKSRGRGGQKEEGRGS